MSIRTCPCTHACSHMPACMPQPHPCVHASAHIGTPACSACVSGRRCRRRPPKQTALGARHEGAHSQRRVDGDLATQESRTVHMSVHVYTHVCAHAYTHVCAHAYTNVCAHVCAHVTARGHALVCTHVCTHDCTYDCTHVRTLRAHMYTCSYLHGRRHTHLKKTSVTI